MAAFAAVILGLTCCAGCGSSDKAEDNPYAAEFEQARASTDNPILMKILEDGKITDEEYVQAMQLDIDCVEEQVPGLKATILPDGGMKFQSSSLLSPDEEKRLDKVSPECSQISAPVNRLYNEIRKNSQNADWSLMTLNCLKKFGVVDDSMTVDELKAVDPNSPPWDPLSGDAYGCETEYAAYDGGEPDLTEPQQWPEGSHF
jgi:hypothetical protein